MSLMHVAVGGFHFSEEKLFCLNKPFWDGRGVEKIEAPKCFKSIVEFFIVITVCFFYSCFILKSLK